MRTTSPSTASTTIPSGARAASSASSRTGSAAAMASTSTAAAPRSCRPRPTTPRTTGSTSPSTPDRRAGELGRRSSPRPRRCTSPENRLTVGTITATDADVNALTYAIAGGADAARFTIDAPDRRAALRDRAELRGPGRRGRQQRLRPDGQRQRRHRAAPVTQAITVTVTDVNETGGDVERLRRDRTRRRRPRPTTRPTTSSA